VVSAAAVHAAERLLPEIPAALVMPIAQVMGTFAYAAGSGAREAVRANLKVIAPDRAGAAMARHIFAEQSRNYLDIFRLPRMDAAALRASIEKRGWETFTTAHEQGRGVIVASAHLGPISLVGQVLVAHGYETVLPVETERSEVQRAVNRGRAAMGLQLVRTDTPLAVVRALRQGKVFGLLADRAVTGVGERVPFFGREALIPSAHIALGLRTGAPVIPAFSLREGRTLVASFEPPLELASTGDRDADVRAGVARWAEVLERYVRRAPEQWTVFERVWSERER
jgi:KDO2-lipid IV(A) lauroyltransferase